MHLDGNETSCSGAGRHETGTAQQHCSEGWGAHDCREGTQEGGDFL